MTFISACTKLDSLGNVVPNPDECMGSGSRNPSSTVEPVPTESSFRETNGTMGITIGIVVSIITLSIIVVVVVVVILIVVQKKKAINNEEDISTDKKSTINNRYIIYS